jgi:aminoglycoside phosphotransferase (APT) family kinase protein
MLDLAALHAHLAAHLGGYAGPLTARAFDEGQSNPTFLLETPGRSYVLRKKPPGALLKSAHAVDREYRVQKALAETEVPVARMLHLCEDDSVLGTVFYVMERVPGRVFWDPALPELSPPERGRVYDEMNRVLAAIHDVDVAAVGLGDFGRPGDYFARQLKRWREQYRATETDPIPDMDALILWLEEHLPPDDGACSLVHGDYRIDNMLFDPETLRVRAVLDWELSTLGHPLADLAYQIMQRAMGRDWKLRGLAGLDLDTLGIPSEDAYVEAYRRRRGLGALPNWGYAKAFAFFRFAAICQGVGKRALDGNAAGADAARIGAMARPLAALGLAAARGKPGKIAT